jgi:hypothetical protein
MSDYICPTGYRCLKIGELIQADDLFIIISDSPRSPTYKLSSYKLAVPESVNNGFKSNSPIQHQYIRKALTPKGNRILT